MWPPAVLTAYIVLIESDWNLKVYWATKCSQVVVSINRIRLEFKVDLSADPAAFALVLIESDWNLKWLLSPFCYAMAVVLIESDWNLKVHGKWVAGIQCPY